MVDVTVRGAGIFGLSVAWACLKRGAKVRVVDPNGVAAGASGGTLGALAPHVPENWNEKKAFQLESLLASERFWRDVQDCSGLETSYGRMGRIQPLADERAVELAHRREETAKALWQAQANWRVVTRDALEGPVPESATGLYVHDTLTARIYPRQGCTALAKALTARGAEITTDARDEGAVLWATGTHDMARLTAHFGKVVGNGVKGQSAVLAYSMEDAPQIYADAVHIVPHWNGTVAVGSTSEREFEDASGTDKKLDDVIAKARQALPALSEAEVIDRWAGLRPRAKSRAPMLGEHPLHTGQFIANGGFKIGFGMAVRVGEVMAALMLDGEDHIPQDFKPEASL